MRFPFSNPWLLGAALLLGTGCGDDKPAPAPTDAGLRFDATPPTDSGPRSDAPGLDAAPGVDGGDLADCTGVMAALVDLGTDTSGAPRVVSIAPHADGFTAAWAQAAVGIDNIWVRRVPTTGLPPDAVQITDDFSISRAPAVVALGSTALLAWYDNSTMGFEIHATALDATGMATGAVSQITHNTLRDDGPALLPIGASVLAAWVEDDMRAGTRIAKTALLSPEGVLIGSDHTVTTPPRSPTRPTLSPISGGAALVWADNRLDMSDVVLVPLDATGAASGGEMTLSSESNADGTVDLWTSDTGGAVVFGTLVGGARHEVRFRPLDASGAPAGPERILTLAPEQATDASIAPFRGGYVVTYRALSDVDLTEPTLRILFLDTTGTEVMRFDGAPVSVDGGRTTVRVSGDGQLMVAWSDTLGRMETSIRSVVVRCAAGAR